MTSAVKLGDKPGVVSLGDCLTVPGSGRSTSAGCTRAELGIIGDNSTNRQRINQSTLSIIGYRLSLETALSVCRLKTKSDDRQIKLSVRTINRYSRMIV